MRPEIRNLGEVQRILDRLPESVFENAKTEFGKTVLGVQRKTDDNIRNKLTVRTGALARGLKTELKGNSLKDLKASVYIAGSAMGQDLVYARIHEYGGRITAKDKYKGVPGGPYLNIPTPANKKESGVTSMQAREVFNAGGNIIKTRSGKWGVFLNGRMMFVLKKSVNIPARLGMRDAADEQIPTLLSALVDLS